VVVKYDPIADAAYIDVVDHVDYGEAVVQIEVEDPDLKGGIILDLDERGFLLGVEILGARKVLRPETLSNSLRVQ
jgi:uncharacterized protein YuzE